MDTFGDLQGMVDKLPQVEQDILRTFFIKDLTQNETAEVVGVSRRTIQTVLRNLRRIDLTGWIPMIMFRGKLQILTSLRG